LLVIVLARLLLGTKI